MLNKKTAIVIAIIFLAAAAGLGAYYLKNKTVLFPSQKKTGSQNCEPLAGRPRDLCLKESALLEADPSVCQAINGAELKADCLSQADLALAVKKSEAGSCQALNNLMLAQACLGKILNENYEKVDCFRLSQTELFTFCQSEKIGRTARKNNNPALCEEIIDGIKKANCLSELKKIDLHSDADNDGLDFLQEIINGTNPDNPDSDGDSQSDGVEIKNNYNPLGAGKLNGARLAKDLKCVDIEDNKLSESCRAEFKSGQIDLTVSCDQIKSAELLNYCLKAQQLFFNQATR